MKLTVREIAELTTDQLVEHLACAYDANDEEPTDDCRPILRELYFIRNDISCIPDELLKDVLTSFLPIHPNGDAHLRALQIALANDIVLPDLLGEDMTHPDWIQVMSDDDLLLVFSIAVGDNRKGADFLARQLYLEIQDRDVLNWDAEASTEELGPIRENMDTVLYSFIRRQLPKVGSKNFRTVAENMLRTLISMHI